MPGKSSPIPAGSAQDGGAGEAERLEATAFSKPGGWAGAAVRTLAVAFSTFQLYTAAFGTFEQFIQRSVHLAFGLALVGLTYRFPHRRDARRTHPGDWLFALLGAFSALYVLLQYSRLTTRISMVTPMEPLDLAAGVILTLAVMEACRRAVSPGLALIALAFVAYGYFGQLIPGRFGHPGIPFDELVEVIFLSTEGIFGIPLGVSATYAFLFVLFGGFIMRLGLMSLFADLALAVAGSTSGGPAKVAIVCSALFGTISGSGIANAITTGSFTVPLMVRVGYKPHFAAGIESAASMGGNIMPPVMGAAAFVMADFLGVPYQHVAVAAIIPALLYFFGAGTMVHFEALRQGIRRIPRSELPSLWNVLLGRGYLLIPIVGLVYFLMSGRSAIFAGFWAIALTIPVSFLRRETRITPGKTLEILEWGALTALPIVAACAVVGVILGIVAQTGLGVKMASAILTFAGGNMFLTLLFAMLASLFLGTGLPTTPTYIITAALTAPALVKFGLPPLAAHFFVFYYGILADITPPTAIAPYALSAIARSDPSRTCWTACMVALSGFIVPFLFAYEPAMLDPLMAGSGTTVYRVVSVTVSAFVGVTMLSAALIGWLRVRMTVLERLILFGGAVALITPGLLTDLAGLSALMLVLGLQTWRRRRSVAAGPTDAA
ncbi:MAG: TRAP transporter permease [Candidatus Rokubacteria bacterium]|nr:TRAP transporter permease [Candidatus Rokubacteria bacterium]